MTSKFLKVLGNLGGGGVKSVNGVAPDENGDVTVEVPELPDVVTRITEEVECLLSEREITKEWQNSGSRYYGVNINSDIPIIEGAQYRVVFDGETYILTATLNENGLTYWFGNEVMSGRPGISNGLPFCVDKVMSYSQKKYLTIYLLDADPHTISIYRIDQYIMENVVLIADNETKYRLTVNEFGVPTFTDVNDSNNYWTPSTVTDSHINSLIDTKLGVIENGTY